MIDKFDVANITQGQTNDLEKVKEIVLTPIAGEITEREPSNGYLIY